MNGFKYVKNISLFLYFKNSLLKIPSTYYKKSFFRIYQKYQFRYCLKKSF